MDIQSLNSVVQAPVATPDKAAPSAASSPPQPAAAPVQVAKAVQQPTAVPNLAQLTQAVKSINKTLQEQAQGVEFAVDADTHRTIVKVVDQKTQEVLRQIPSEEVLEIAKALDNLQQGLIIRQKV